MITINYRDKRALYEQIYDKIKQLILLNALDEKLPSIRSLANELNVNPNTVQKVYKMLENDGYIYTVVGRGIFISDDIKVDVDKEKELKKKIIELINIADIYEYDLKDIINILNKTYEEVKNNDKDK